MIEFEFEFAFEVMFESMSTFKIWIGFELNEKFSLICLSSLGSKCCSSLNTNLSSSFEIVNLDLFRVQVQVYVRKCLFKTEFVFELIFRCKLDFELVRYRVCKRITDRKNPYLLGHRQYNSNKIGY